MQNSYSSDAAVMNGGYGMVRDEHQLPHEFYYKERRIRANEPVFEAVEFIKIFLPGGDMIDRPVTDKEREHYAAKYRAFKGNAEAPAMGWPLSQVPWLDVAQVATYKALNIPTVEALAAAPDTTIQGIMGSQKHRDMARASIEAMEGAKPLLRITEENESLRAQLELQSAQITELCEEMEKLKANKKTPSFEDD
jgi:hypothetical protein